MNGKYSAHLDQIFDCFVTRS